MGEYVIQLTVDGPCDKILYSNEKEYATDVWNAIRGSCTLLRKV